jgi:hypothetical protein
MKFPVFPSIAATFDVLARNMPDIFRIVWAPMLLLGLINALVMPRYMAEMSALLDLGPSADPGPLMQAASAILPDMLLMLAFDLIAYPVIFAGLLRLVLHNERPPRIAYLGFGLDELRIIGTWALLFMTILGLVILSQVISGASQALGRFAGSGGQAVGYVLDGAALALLIWVGVRLSLATAAAVGLSRLGVGPSWTATRGVSLSLLAYWAIFVLAGIVLQTLLFNLLSPQQAAILAEAAGAQTPEARAEIANRANAAAIAALDFTEPANLARFILQQMVGFVLLTIAAIASGVAWRHLSQTRRTV